MRRARVFIDFWNYQLGWNVVMNPRRCDRRGLPAALVGATGAQFHAAGIADAPVLEETRLYASVDPVGEEPLRRWLTGTLDRFASWRVEVRDRRPRPKQVHCRECGAVTTSCPTCARPYVAKPEKGVDAAIVTDLLSLAWQEAYDVAILVTSDADFVPAVQRVQERGLKVVNAGWAGKGHELKAACWAAFDVDTVTASICR